MATKRVCSFNKYGFCKYLETCRNFHEKEICENSQCEVRKCPLRHPKICKFLRDNGYCKFGEFCYFSHKIKKHTDLTEVKDLKKKVLAMENSAKEKDDLIKKLVHESNAKFENLQNEIEKKFQSFEESLNLLKKCVLDKDIVIESLENRLNEKLDKNTTKVKCSKCDFEGSSKHGLKVHMARKHTLHIDSKSKICEVCDQEFETLSKMKKHLKTHSYKKVEFKCVECDFVGSSEETMEVHYGKNHSDSFECGICEYKAETLESLEIHLVTCELFKCLYCNYSDKNLSEFKKHTTKEHEPG